jgi:hypothetical protein
VIWLRSRKVLGISIATDLGEIVIALETVRAPVTVSNFLRYVDGKYYDGGQFHRTVTLENQPDSEVKIEAIPRSARDQSIPRAAIEVTDSPPTIR